MYDNTANYTIVYQINQDCNISYQSTSQSGDGGYGNGWDTIG